MHLTDRQLAIIIGSLVGAELSLSSENERSELRKLAEKIQDEQEKRINKLKKGLTMKKPIPPANPLAHRYAKEVAQTALLWAKKDLATANIPSESLELVVVAAFMEVMGDKMTWAPEDLAKKIAYDTALKEFNRFQDQNN